MEVAAFEPGISAELGISGIRSQGKWWLPSAGFGGEAVPTSWQQMRPSLQALTRLP